MAPSFGVKLTAAFTAILPEHTDIPAYMAGLFMGLGLAIQHPEWAQGAKRALWRAGADFESHTAFLDRLVEQLPVTEESELPES